MREFFIKHPFLGKLLKRSVSVVVVWNVVLVCLIGTLFLLGGVFASGDYEDEGSYSYIYGPGVNELLSIRVSGTITGTEAAGGLLSGAWEVSGYDIKEQLYAAADDDLINGVILEIESPGGTIYGSRAIAEGVEYYKETTGNPVYAYIEGLAASGGYWAAVSADKIIADYGSDIGSIGVVMGPFQYYDTVLAKDNGLLEGGVITQKGIQQTMITAGKSKDLGNPYRRLTTEEITQLQQSANNEYDNFVQYVSERRKIPADTIRGTIGAMAYDNKTAQELKLIDQSGSREAAYEALAEAAGIEEDFQIIREEYEPSFVESLLSAVTRKPQPAVQTTDCTVLRSSLLAYHGAVDGLCKTD